MTRTKDGRARTRAIVGALLIVAWLTFSADAALAVPPPVTNTNDSGAGSLRASIAAAVDGDTVTVPAGTYTLTSNELVVDTFITIQGAGASTTIIRAAGNFRVFRVALTVNGSPPEATIRGVTITGGRAPSSTFQGGGGILSTSSTILTVDQSVITGNSASSPGASTSGHGGGGISQESSGSLTLTNSTVSGNSVSYGPGGTSNGGGGVHSSSGGLTIANSTINGNTLTSSGSVSNVGGGGIHAGGSSLSIGNSTISGNSATVPSGGTNGGGGVYSSTTAALDNATIASNSTNGAGGGLLQSSAQTSTLRLDTTIVAGNTLGGCATAGAGSVLSGGRNMESPGNTCNLGAADFPSTDPQLGPLVDNGGPTPTRALAPGSPAIDNADTAICLRAPGSDQRGVTRPKGVSCDIGAYEFDGLSSAAPGCSTGTVGVDLLPPAGSSATSAHFRVDGGGEGIAAAGGSPARAAVPVPDGNHVLEYWGEFSPSGQELAHHVANVLVDSVPPLVRILSDQRREGYTVGERATFSVRASDAGTGLASDPTASRRPIDTRRARSVTIRRTARDNCGNETTGSLRIKVLPKPVFGKRVNLIPLSGEVFVRLPGAGPSATARASQKGRKFIPIQQARQVPVGSLIDTRRGRVRLVSARAPRARRVQAGQFYSGLFQVLQSRKKRAKGLTTLRLKGANFRRCNTRRGRRAGAAQSRRALRRLRARARGRFRTRGRYSAATVRGTTWTTTDRCDGTLTRVGRGRVAVRDFRRRKTIVLRRGKSYLAKAPRR